MVLRLQALVIALLLALPAAGFPWAVGQDSASTSTMNREAVARLVNAKLFQLQGKYAQSAAELTRAVALDSTSATLYRLLAEDLLRLGSAREALGAARRAATLDTANVDLRWLLVRSLQSAGDDSTASLELESLVSLAPGDLKAYDQLGNIYRRTGQRDRLIALLDRLLRLPDLSLQTRLLVAQRFAEAQALDRAEEVCRSILKESSGVGPAWYALAQIALARKDTLSSARICRQATGSVDIREHEPIRQLLANLYRSDLLLSPVLTETPPDTAFLFKLGRIFLGSRDTTLYRKAVQVLDHAVSGIQPTAEQWIDLANAHRVNGDHLAAVSLLQKAAAQFPASGDVHYTLGYALIAAGKLEEAALSFEKALAIAPDNPLFHYGVGLVQQRRKQWPEAAQRFRTLAEKTQRTPLYIDVLFSLGSSLERAGRFAESVDTFQKLINLSPQHAEALNYLGYMFAEKGIRLEEAESLVKRALQIDADNGAFMDSLGWTYYQQGRNGEAEPLLDQAIQAEIARKSDGENLSVIYDHIGDNAWKLNNTLKALEAWRKALEAKPGDRKIAEKIEARRKNSSKP